MPADFLINAQHKVVFSYGWGTLTAKDVVDHKTSLQQTASFRPDYKQITMLSDAAGMNLTNAELFSLARDPAFAPTALRAVVADKSPHFGLAKVYEGYSTGSVTRVFRSLEEAAEWVDVPLGVASQAFKAIRDARQRLEQPE